MKRLVLAVLAALLLIVPAADAKAFRATVVKRNLATHTVVAATRAGTLKVLHNRRDRVGTILRINGRHVKAVGHARRVKIRGIVVRHTARTVTLSAGRATVRVRTRHARVSGRRHGHQLGNGLRMTAKISSNGTLTEVNEAEDNNVDGAELKGMLVCTPTADPSASGACTLPDVLIIDIGATGAPIQIPVHFTAANFPDLDTMVGQQVEAEVSMAASVNPGSVDLTLVAIQSEQMCQANDDDQGNGGGGDDLRARHHGGDDGCEIDD